MMNLVDVRKNFEELRAKLRLMNDELMGGKAHTEKEWKALIDENNKLQREYHEVYKVMKRMEAVEMEKLYCKQDAYIKSQLEANGVEVIKIKHWKSDPMPYVEIAYKHRPQHGQLQETIGDALGVLLTIKA